MPLAGYLNPGYARALEEFGEPRPLPRSGGWYLRRPIPGSDRFDGMSCYPYLACTNWHALADDVAELRDDLVSFVATPDPFGSYERADLSRAFPDRVRHFKDHYVADLSRAPDEIVSKHHRLAAQKALASIDVECTGDPLRYADLFVELFGETARRFGATGIRAFSDTSLRAQLALPGCFMSIARHNGDALAAHVQFLAGGTVYAHAHGAREVANALGASYALYYSELLYFAGKAATIDWGGDAGTGRRSSLGDFKRGWSTGTREALFCGAIFDRAAYDALSASRDQSATEYFPAYRAGELA